MHKDTSYNKIGTPGSAEKLATARMQSIAGTLSEYRNIGILSEVPTSSKYWTYQCIYYVRTINVHSVHTFNTLFSPWMVFCTYTKLHMHFIYLRIVNTFSWFFLPVVAPAVDCSPDRRIKSAGKHGPSLWEDTLLTIPNVVFAYLHFHGPQLSHLASTVVESSSSSVSNLEIFYVFPKP